METMLLVTIILFLAPLIVSIVVAAQCGKLRSSVDELKRRVSQLETKSVDRPA